MRIPTFAMCRSRCHRDDITDWTNLILLMQQIRPTEICNLAAQSHVGVSFRKFRIYLQCRRDRRAATPGSDPDFSA
ncbi:GDP-mannose 4,6-dehydratase [Bradyrhizobium sp. McL0615]|uniref:GDP-mannose 4,6-dehydratase n=1 Tax=Bradyrhizobium sp. McL0615 TaxID=3415673 RepID=UPI003CFBB98E